MSRLDQRSRRDCLLSHWLHVDRHAADTLGMHLKELLKQSKPSDCLWLCIGQDPCLQQTAWWSQAGAATAADSGRAASRTRHVTLSA